MAFIYCIHFIARGGGTAPVFISNMRPKLYGFHWGEFSHVDLFLLRRMKTLFFVYGTHKGGNEKGWILLRLC